MIQFRDGWHKIIGIYIYDYKQITSLDNLLKEEKKKEKGRTKNYIDLILPHLFYKLTKLKDLIRTSAAAAAGNEVYCPEHPFNYTEGMKRKLVGNTGSRRCIMDSPPYCKHYSYSFLDYETFIQRQICCHRPFNAIDVDDEL